MSAFSPIWREVSCLIWPRKRCHSKDKKVSIQPEKDFSVAHLEKRVFVFQLFLPRKSFQLARHRPVAERRQRRHCWRLLKEQSSNKVDFFVETNQGLNRNLECVFIIAVVHIDCIEGGVSWSGNWFWRSPGKKETINCLIGLFFTYFWSDKGVSPILKRLEMLKREPVRRRMFWQYGIGVFYTADSCRPVADPTKDYQWFYMVFMIIWEFHVNFTWGLRRRWGWPGSSEGSVDLRHICNIS